MAMSKKAMREERDHAMVELANAGWTYAAIGRVVGIKDDQHVSRRISLMKAIHRRIDSNFLAQRQSAN